jgi:hypothetical protein
VTKSAGVEVGVYPIHNLFNIKELGKFPRVMRRLILFGCPGIGKSFVMPDKKKRMTVCLEPTKK